MKPFSIATLVLLAGVASGAVTFPVGVPHTFTNGAIADADQVNANFGVLEAAVDDLGTRLGGAISLVAGEDLVLGEAVRVSSGDNGETAGRVYLASAATAASALVSDDFERADNMAVGNGFSETETVAQNFRVFSNHLLMQGSAGAASNTVLHHAIGANNSLELRFGLQWDDGTGGSHRVSFVTGSTGAFDTGYGVRLNRDNATSVTLSVVDGTAILTSASVPMADAIWHEVEIRILADYSIEARIWTSSRPAAATLAWGASTPSSAGGTRFAIHRTQSGGNSRNVNIDDLTISGLTNGDTVIGVAGADTATGADVGVVFSGPVEGLAGLTTGSRYYLSSSAGGISTEAADATTPRVGVALTPTTLLVMP